MVERYPYKIDVIGSSPIVSTIIRHTLVCFSFGKKTFEDIMKSILIKLKNADDVKKFVSIVERYEFEIDLRCGRHVVNAKSILGILSLDLSDTVVLEVYTDDCINLIENISEFIA